MAKRVYFRGAAWKDLPVEQRVFGDYFANSSGSGSSGQLVNEDN